MWSYHAIVMKRSSMTSAFDNSILAKVTAAIQATTFLQAFQITAESRFDEDLDLDRLEVMEVVIHIEEVFDTEFPAEVILQFESVPDVVRYLSRRFFSDAAELVHVRAS